MVLKDSVTEEVRRLLRSHPDVIETDRAESGLTTLSFQSRSIPNRHVWIDTDLGGELMVDLEDWSNDETWDNSVLHVSGKDHCEGAEIISRWLSGRPVAECAPPSGSTRP